MDRLSEAIALIEEGDVSKGLDMLQQVTKDGDDDQLFQVVQTYVRLGLLIDANELIDHLLQKYPDETELRLLAAECLIGLNKEEEAIQHLNNITKDDEHYLHALLLLADLYQSQGLEEVAEQKLLYARQLAPEEPVISYALAEFYLSQGRAHQAIPFYEKILNELDDLPKESIFINYAEALSMDGEFEKALFYYEKGLRMQPQPDHLFKYGYTALRAEQFEKAIQALEDLKAADSHYSTLYPHLASAYEAIGALDEAMETLESGMKVDEFNDELYFLAAKLSFKMGNKAQAETFLMKTLRLNPGSVKAVHMLLSFLKQENRYNEVIEHILQLKEAGEDDPLFEWDLARAHQALEAFDLARQHYESAYSFFQHDAQFLAEYGHFLLQEGECIKALKLYRKALETDCQLEELKELITELEEREQG